MDGVLEQVGDRSVLRFRRELSQPREKVWRALTEPEHLAKWFPTSIDGERKAGAPLRFSFRDGEGDDFEGEMLGYDPRSLFEFRWGPDILRAGWHACLDVLAYEVAGAAAPWTPSERWADVHDGYVEDFGPEASTVGPPNA
jgi:hypothetical protein